MAFEQSFFVGEWQVQPRLNRIATKERTVQLEPKVMDVLLTLADHRGQVVERQRLLASVWADTVVGEEVLSRAVSQLRKAFGDDARDPHVIETIHKTGYRLIAPVELRGMPGDEAPSVGVSRASVRPARRRRWLLRIAGVAAAAVVLLVAVYVIAGRPAPDSRLVLRTVPATTFRGTEFHPALSPQGARLAFIWTGPENGHLDLYVKMLNSETPVQLTEGPFYEYSPSWSPDGSEIAFGRFGTGIFVIPALGGPERKLVSVEASARPHVAWSPDGSHIAYTDRPAPDHPYRVHLLPLSGGEPRVLTAPPATYEGDSSPAFSPDGTRLAFVRTTSNAADVYVLPLDAATSWRLTFDAAEVAGVSWSQDGRHVLFASRRSGEFAVWRIPHTGGEPELVAATQGSDLLQPSMRADRMAYTQATMDANIWEIPADGDPAPLFASTRMDFNPHVSPNGDQVTFVSTRSGSMEVWIADAEGLEPTKLTEFTGGSVGNPRWSPDGSEIAFDAGAGGQSDVYVVRVADRRVRRITTHEAADVAPSWSRDGSHLYFGSNRGDSWGVWSVPSMGGTPGRIIAGGFFAQEAADGSLLFTRSGREGLWRRTPDGTESTLVETLAAADWSNWSLLGNQVYFVHRAERAVHVTDLSSRSTESYVDLPELPYWSRPGMSVSPSGSVLYARVDHSTYDIIVSDRP